MAMANWLGCSNDLSRAAHDKLIAELEHLIGLTRQALHAARATVLTGDPVEQDEL